MQVSLGHIIRILQSGTDFLSTLDTIMCILWPLLSVMIAVLKSTSTPASPQHLSTANHYSPGSGSCAINGSSGISNGRSHSPKTNMSSLVNQQQQQQQSMMAAAASAAGHHQLPPHAQPSHNHMDLELLTKTLKKDCKSFCHTREWPAECSHS